ncbi:MAG: hypothetical protein ACLQO7_10465 [Candidatus Bathyarchaeia archaeon]
MMSVTGGNWYDDIHWVNAPCPQYSEVISTTNTYDGYDSWQCTLSPNGWGVDWYGGKAATIAPGDTIYYSFWIKTSQPTLPQDVNNPIAGARIGVDIYGSNSQGGIEDINGVSTYDGKITTWVNGNYVYPSVADQDFVMFGTNTWTQVVIEFTVQPTYPEIDQNTCSNPAGYTNGENVVPTFCIPWVQVYSCTQGTKEGGTAWFADPVFMINSSGSSVSVSQPATSPTSNIIASNIALEPSYTANGQSFVESGFVVPINVTVQNKEDFSELASVELFANSTSIYKGTLNLNSFATGIIDCSVDTSNLPIGHYTITASVFPLDEPNSAPSTITAGNVGITYAGDLNGGFQINFMDLITFAADYTACCAHGTYNPAIDFNHDGTINFYDITLFTSCYTYYYSQPQE